MLGLFAYGCGEDGEEEEASDVKTIDAAFLVSSDLVPGTSIETTSQSSMLEELGGISDLYANDPEEADTGAAEDEEDDCVGDLMDQIKVKVSGDTMAVGAEIDLGSCMGEAAPEGIELTKAIMKMYFEFTCAGADLSAYDGKSFGDLEDETAAPECTSSGTLMNIEANMAMKGTYTISGISVSVDSETRSVTFNGGAGMKSCTETLADSTWTIADDCIVVERSIPVRSVVNGEEQPGEERFTRLDFRGVTGPDDDTSPWYATGTVDLAYNNWSGQVTYSGATTAPTYTLSNGFEQITGTVNDGGLQLHAAHLRSRLAAEVPALVRARFANFH
jgi:hypothetical protein